MLKTTVFQYQFQTKILRSNIIHTNKNVLEMNAYYCAVGIGIPNSAMPALFQLGVTVA